MKIGRVYGTFQVDFKYTEHYLAEELSKNNYETTFITSDKYLNLWKRYLKSYDPVGTYDYTYYKVIRIPAFFPLEKAVFKNIFKLNTLLFRSNFDVLHLYGLGNLSTIQVLILSLLKGKKSPPIVISDHTSPETHVRDGAVVTIYTFVIKVILKFLKFKIHKIISFSSVGASVLEDKFGISKNKFTTIPLGYNQNIFRHLPKKRKTTSRFILGYAGKIDTKKRIDFLIDTLNESLDIFADVKLIIVGINFEDAYCKSLIAMADKSKLNIEFRPFANSDELNLFYNEIDVAIYPGSISITTIEANGSGAPVIIYESINGLEARVKNGRGKLFKTSNELIDHIKYYYDLFKEKKIPHKIIEKETKESSSWHTLQQRYIEIYNESIKS